MPVLTASVNRSADFLSQELILSEIFLLYRVNIPSFTVCLRTAQVFKQLRHQRLVAISASCEVKSMDTPPSTSRGAHMARSMTSHGL